jgi:hypothetical protein
MSDTKGRSGMNNRDPSIITAGGATRRKHTCNVVTYIYIVVGGVCIYVMSYYYCMPLSVSSLLFIYVVCADDAVVAVGDDKKWLYVGVIILLLLIVVPACGVPVTLLFVVVCMYIFCCFRMPFISSVDVQKQQVFSNYSVTLITPYASPIVPNHNLNNCRLLLASTPAPSHASPYTTIKHKLIYITIIQNDLIAHLRRRNPTDPYIILRDLRLPSSPEYIAASSIAMLVTPSALLILNSMSLPPR